MAGQVVSLLADVYSALAGVVEGLGEADAWSATGCTGWAVRDLVHHVADDAVRGLVAAHTPATVGADCDAVSYWRSWGNEPEKDEAIRRFTRAEASLRGWAQLRERHLESAAATVRALDGLPEDAVLTTQGHALAAADLASTLAVEATLHHADLVVHLDAAPPTAVGWAEVRRVVESLLGKELPGWTDERVALVGTGRAKPIDDERRALTGTTVPVFS